MDKDKLVELAERCETKAVGRITDFLDSNEQRSAYDGADRIGTAESLLNIAAALRSHALRNE